MKILDAITEASRQRVPVNMGRISAASSEDPVDIFGSIQQWRIIMTTTVGFQMTGPEAAIPEMHLAARKAIGNEVFGEIRDDLLELRTALWEEPIYREPNDPALNIVDTILRKISGEVVER